MSDNSIIKKTARIVLVESVPGRRMLMADIMRGAGFSTVVTVNKPQDLIGQLKVGPIDWIIMPLSSEHTVNGMHILKILTTYANLHNTRVSMLFTQEERIHIPLAFELGLLSCHVTPYNRESMTNSIEGLLRTIKNCSLDMTLVAAEYLRAALVELRQPHLRLTLEQSLNEIYTADPRILINLAKAQSGCGLGEEAESTLNYVEIIAKGSKEELTQIRKEFQVASFASNAAESSGAPGSEPAYDLARSPVKSNLLGLKSCVIIDPDSSTQFIAETLLKDAGITNIAIFSDGNAAWEALQDKPEPDLIMMEWVLPGLAGPLILQRLRQKGFLHVPIVITSLHVKPEDMPLVSEMGVSAVIDKPLDQRTFFKSIITVIQQSHRPHEQVSLEKKIRQLLESGSLGEAERLWKNYRSDTRIPPSAQWQLEAEFHYAYNRFEEAADQASNALQEFPNSLSLLNLLGKCLLRLGRYKVALKCFARAQNISPNNVERLCRIAETQHFLQNKAGVKVALDKAESLDPDNELLRETKTNIALDSGEVRQASELMGKLDSLRGVLAFMNNRAIALTRAGQFDDGITLYRNTIVALPGQWSEIHDSIAYNLGLAHARYGELDKAIDMLGRIKQPNLTLKRKSSSLLSRLHEAKKTGGALTLVEAPEPKQPEPKASKDPSGDLLSRVELRKGDMCCFMLFHVGEAANPQSLQLLAQMPAFIKKTESGDRTAPTQTHVKPLKKAALK